MNNSASTEPANKKADDEAIHRFVAEHETGVIAPEVADAFDIGKTTAREALARLENAGRLDTRKAGSTIKLYYATRDGADESDARKGVFGSVEFLTDDQLAYLTSGTLGDLVEPHVLDRLSKRFVETTWEIPYDDGPDREQMQLVARRLDVSLDDIRSMTPNEVISRIDTVADDLRTDFDLLYHPFRTPRMAELHELREGLFKSQEEVAERLSEPSGWTVSTCQSKLSTWESRSIDPGKEIREDLAAIYREFYEERADPYRPRDEWTPPASKSDGPEEDER